jgi:3-deoxy-D-manno-octulosonate 8-phosphate phosphatase (KDO 8-P phosphatase)
VAIITGRSSDIVQRRASELGISEIIQGREDKIIALQQLAQRLDLDLRECAYMGDDLPDLAAMRAAGIGMTVADAVATVAKYADWQSRSAGGQGAVREACEYLLAARDALSNAEADYL